MSTRKRRPGEWPSPLRRANAGEGAESARGERVCEAQLDERLTGHADALGFLIDSFQQVDREIHVHTLDFTPRAASSGEINV
jgi:hypothetical protein